jgi:hypothetical protein
MSASENKAQRLGLNRIQTEPLKPTNNVIRR